MIIAAVLYGLGAFFALGPILGPLLGMDMDEDLMEGLVALGNWIFFMADILTDDPVWAAFNGVVAAIFTYRWWKGRRGGGGKKAARELGAKSLALIQSLARKMTPSPIPVPTGAPA